MIDGDEDGAYHDRVPDGPPDRFFYTGAVQLGYPTASGSTPHLFAGGGGFTIKEKESPSGVNVDKTKGAGVGGIGFSYPIPRTNWSLLTEGIGYV